MRTCPAGDKKHNRSRLKRRRGASIQTKASARNDFFPETNSFAKHHHSAIQSSPLLPVYDLVAPTERSGTTRHGDRPDTRCRFYRVMNTVMNNYLMHKPSASVRTQSPMNAVKRVASLAASLAAPSPFGVFSNRAPNARLVLCGFASPPVTRCEAVCGSVSAREQMSAHVQPVSERGREALLPCDIHKFGATPAERVRVRTRT